MSTQKHLAHLAVLIIMLASVIDCAKKEDTFQEQSATSSESSSQSSTVADQSNESEVATSQASTTEISKEIENAEDRLQKQRDEVRQAFISLQEICKANSIDEYIAFWDDETKMAIDGRDLDLNERRERRRSTLVKKPETLQKIGTAKIESITVDTSKAESIESVFGVELKGTMMLVHTDGPDLFFHETDKGWKLNSIHH